MDPYPTTEVVSPVTSPLVAYCNNSPLVAPSFLHAIMVEAVATIAEQKNAMIVGSSDFTHYEPNEFAHKQDKALIEPILDLNVEQFYKVLYEKNVTACGYGAIASTMIACKKLGATKGELLQYATSGDVTGDTTSVVGYGSIIFT